MRYLHHAELNIRKLIVDYTEEAYDRVADLDLRGALPLSAGLRPSDDEAGRRQPGAVLVDAGRHPGAGPGHRRGHQGRHRQRVKGFAAEVGSYGVRVNAIMPSVIETRLTAPPTWLTQTRPSS